MSGLRPFRGILLNNRTLPPVTAPRARAVLALVSASRHGTESARRKWLLRFCQNYGPPLTAVNWRQPIQKIPFSIVAAGCRHEPARERSFLAVCIHVSESLPPPVRNPVPGLIELDTPPE